MKKSILVIRELPNFAVPMTLLADMGGLPKATLRNWKRKGWIRPFKRKGEGDMISLAEMTRLEDEGLLKIAK